MKRHWIEYTEKWVPSMLSYWVPIEAEGSDWYNARFFQPPLPFPVSDPMKKPSKPGRSRR